MAQDTATEIFRGFYVHSYNRISSLHTFLSFNVRKYLYKKTYIKHIYTIEPSLLVSIASLSGHRACMWDIDLIISSSPPSRAILHSFKILFHPHILLDKCTYDRMMYMDGSTCKILSTEKAYVWNVSLSHICMWCTRQHNLKLHITCLYNTYLHIASIHL